MQKMLGNEHGGMNETLANLYGLTGDEKYLQIALRFNHMAVIGPASKREDKLTGLHANTQIPKFIGTARQYELTGTDGLKTASRFFWDTVAKERSYVIGGHSDGEMFSPKERLSQALGPNTTETCNTYNMLKLTRHLFCWNPQAEYADFYERALYNHILASQHPESGMMCYYVPLRSGSRKNYNGPLDAFWCCTGTGVENHAKYGDSIYFHDGAKTLFVDQFIASELNWRAAGVKLKQETSYPDESSTKLTVTAAPAGEWTMRVRHPAWAGKGFVVKVNGQAAPDTMAGSYVTLKRAWKAGDVVEVQMPFALHSEGFADNPNRRAVMYGPIVLAAGVPAAPAPPRGRGAQTQEAHNSYPKVKGAVGEFVSGLKPVPGKPNTFTAGADVLAWPADATTSELTFSPLYKIYNTPYMVYFDRAE
jgi:hypothetical protein